MKQITINKCEECPNYLHYRQDVLNDDLPENEHLCMEIDKEVDPQQIDKDCPLEERT